MKALTPATTSAVLAADAFIGPLQEPSSPQKSSLAYAKQSSVTENCAMNVPAG
ncbi:hypothetical protein [Streptomyces sp. NPDC088726]|uniref:hypothetical protein n=1 Tax=Streptomyces sp. NPDC088726 TaxID=3365874 RepID=UPI0037FA71E8